MSSFNKGRDHSLDGNICSDGNSNVSSMSDGEDSDDEITTDYLSGAASSGNDFVGHIRHSVVDRLNRAALFFVIYTFLFFAFFNTLSYTLPFVLALFCSLLLQRPTNYLKRKLKFSTWISSLITTFIFFSIIICILTLGIATITSEIIQFGNSIKDLIEKNYSSIYNFISTNIDKLRDSYSSLDPSITNTIENNLQSYPAKISELTILITSKIGSGILNFVASIPNILMVIIFTFITTYFFTKDISTFKAKVLKVFPKQDSSRISSIFHESKKMLSNYFLSYSIIIFVTFVETLIFFWALGVKYFIFLSLLAGIFDILPILGIGTIYVPLAIVYFSTGHTITAILVLSMLCVVTIVRNIIEPKIVSSTLGIHPVLILASIFIGLKVNGFAGIIFCLFLVIFYKVFREVQVL